MDEVVCPDGIHEYEFPPLAVSVDDCPEQIDVFPEMAATGAGLTVTVTAAVSAQVPEVTKTE